ncbi:peptide chain release factor N(5)-glutamine methyltransferase [Stygiobacter electus]|uniref:Release factor glutamine methyltransferase n=1 Tax=Stygiobacter electus TaxID=3032292 RepID=A0AAE3NYF7_9BACT|nr:peptide chain release factor N(5)-glutamine methyltransferase [Stygiobacter electus]MDF1612396.1 peptide chain release factor N(5)-glutamine methyltransferase [Stygiobacter electus]
MLNVLDAINLSSTYLEKKNISSPRLNAELLLAEVLSCKRIDLYLSFDRPLTEHEINDYREFIRRRGNHEPLQYIIGKAEFYGNEFIVNENVLIPRPETEILVDEVIAKNVNSSSLKILDVGTGSGIIAVSLAKELITANFDAFDVSEEAVNIALKNASLNGVSDKINFFVADIFNYEGNNDYYDIIVSNPPYISHEDYNNLEIDVKEYEPKISLTDLQDGLTYYKTIINKSSKWLKKDGYLFFEIGYNQGKDVENLMNEYFYDIKVVKDFQNFDRVIYGVKK